MTLELDNHAAGRASRRQAIREAKVAEELEAFVIPYESDKKTDRVALHGYIIVAPYRHQSMRTQCFAEPHKACEEKEVGGEGVNQAESSLMRLRTKKWTMRT